jgi:hypothetical protein
VSATLVIIGGLTLLALLAGWLRTSQRAERQQILERENFTQRRFLESAFQESGSTDSSSGEGTPAEQDRLLQLQMSARSPDLMRFTEGIWRSILPTSPLTGLSMGAGGEWPDHYRHAGPSTTRTLTRSTRRNPLLAGVGAFDMTLLVGVILPLAVIVLTYDVAAGDREQGRWDLLQSHASSIPRLIVIRCIARAGALALVVITLTACCAVIFRTGRWDVATMRNLLIWSSWASAYLAFWTSLAILLNFLHLTSTGTGLLFLLCWTLLVLALPISLQSGINDRFRMPPQAELVSMEDDVREQVEQEADGIWAEFLRQHPEIKLDDDNPQQEQLLRDVAISRVVRSRVHARIETYFQRFLDREDVLDRLQLLTPLLAWRTADEQCAGTSLHHFVEFARQTAAFHDEYVSYFEPMSLAGSELSLADIREIPRFDARPLQTRLHLPPLLLSAASLLLWTAACGLLSWWCFRRGELR